MATRIALRVAEFPHRCPAATGRPGRAPT